MRLLVTGGFGFIGSHFARMASQMGHIVTILDKLTYAANPLNIPKDELARINFIQIDIADSAAINNLFKETESFDCIVNFAAESHVDRSIVDTQPFLNSNVIGTINMLELCKKGVAKRLLQVSTDEVYGSIRSGSWQENSPLLPRSPYSASKASAELFCQAYVSTHELVVTTIRSANNFGPCQSVEKFIPKIISSLSSNRPVEVYGDGRNKREWVYVGHVAEILLELVWREDLFGGTYNIGGVEMSNLELVFEIAKRMNMEPEIKFTEDRKGHDFRYSVDDDLIYTKLSGLKKTNFASQLSQTVDWYCSNSEWVKLSQELLNK